MSREILMLADALAREKNVDKEVVFEALEQALASATKKRFKEESDVRVSIDRETGDYECLRRWLVVSEADLESEGYQILLIDAQDKIPDIFIRDKADSNKVSFVRFRQIVGERVGQFPASVTVEGDGCSPLAFTPDIDLANLAVRSSGVSQGTVVEQGLPISASDPADPYKGTGPRWRQLNCRISSRPKTWSA